MSADNVKWQVNRAIRRSNLAPNARLIMWTLSDLAAAETGFIPMKQSPSLADLARETGLGESTVKAQLTVLEALGWVQRARPDAGERARHISTYYRIQVGSAGEERPVLKRKPRAKSKPSNEGVEGQEIALADSQEQALEDAPEGQELSLEIESEGQEQAPRGPGDSPSRARSKPSYLKDDDLYDHDDQTPAADAAPLEGKVIQGELIPAPEKLPAKRARKAAAPKQADPLGDTAQELTVAFVEKFKGRNVQPFPAIRGVVKAALAGDVPRNVVAHALNALGEAGMPVSGGTLTKELGRMRQAANGGGNQNSGSDLGGADHLNRYLARAALRKGSAA